MSLTPLNLLGGETLPELTGDRIRLRMPGVRDLPALFDLGSHPEVSRYWSRPPMREPAEAEGLLREIEVGCRARALFQWGIARRSDDALLGCCTLYHVEPAHRRAEIGYSLRRDFWGAGYMSEALDLLLRFAFGPLDLHRLEADTDPRNDRSLRLLERLGFRREGYLRQRFHVAGEVQDSVLLGLLRPEWSPAAGAGPGRRSPSD